MIRTHHGSLLVAFQFVISVDPMNKKWDYIASKQGLMQANIKHYHYED